MINRCLRPTWSMTSAAKGRHTILIFMVQSLMAKSSFKWDLYPGIVENQNFAKILAKMFRHMASLGSRMFLMLTCLLIYPWVNTIDLFPPRIKFMMHFDTVKIDTCLSGVRTSERKSY